MVLGRTDGKVTVGRACGLGRGDGDVGALVDLYHFRCLFFPVLVIVLDDAEGVDPDVPDTELSREVDSITVALGKRIPGNSSLIGPVSVLGESDVNGAAPAVAQTNVATTGPIALNQSYIGIWLREMARNLKRHKI